MSTLQLGDVKRSGIQWGPRPTSRRSTCPACGRFIKIVDGQSRCSCGTELDVVAQNYLQVVGERAS